MSKIFTRFCCISLAAIIAFSSLLLASTVKAQAELIEIQMSRVGNQLTLVSDSNLTEVFPIIWGVSGEPETPGEISFQDSITATVQIPFHGVSIFFNPGEEYVVTTEFEPVGEGGWYNLPPMSVSMTQNGPNLIISTSDSLSGTFSGLLGISGIPTETPFEVVFNNTSMVTVTTPIHTVSVFFNPGAGYMLSTNMTRIGNDQSFWFEFEPLIMNMNRTGNYIFWNTEFPIFGDFQYMWGIPGQPEKWLSMTFDGTETSIEIPQGAIAIFFDPGAGFYLETDLPGSEWYSLLRRVYLPIITK